MKFELRYNPKETSWRVYAETSCVFEAWGANARERAVAWMEWIEGLKKEEATPITQDGSELETPEVARPQAPLALGFKTDGGVR